MAANTTDVILNIRTFDSHSEPVKEHSCVTVPKEAQDKTLSELRKKLVDAKVLDSKVRRSPFCNVKGAVIGDETKFSLYLRIIDEKETEKDPRADDGHPEGSCSNTAKPSTPDRFNQAGSEKFDPKALKDLVSSFSASNFVASTGSGNAKHPVDMTEADWDVVLKRNNLLSGNSVTLTKVQDPETEIETTQVIPWFPQFRKDGVLIICSAFRVKARKMLSSEETEVESKIQLKDNDKSYVEVTETKTALSNMMAKESFSQTDVEASPGAGGAAGFSAGVTAGLSKADQDLFKKTNETSSASMHITYNVFPSKVLLGGRLYYTQETSSFGNSSFSERSKALKVAASLSFSSPYVQASASASHEDRIKTAGSDQSANFNNAITWHAQGGDTLLCNKSVLSPV
ncbi:hypothetical protein T310_5842 [Rasamsonia emersonii CBS 393.64]|uniref:MACPF domain-containing protein n=1 Tax=Rasamsonia emersonii (strain ATCC 16479 / CBS 393.64 / IMI 116815) TaxID=1408163 RepID=A0A0F4YPG2_RASE3|nr:hypothetical protein T310_5842 [Rasamsonia emersonii CBS 393.64]KKA20142.1 hypothetical protein T310_5842 [Rasamsonia emersonii CBS 393.64]